MKYSLHSYSKKKVNFYRANYASTGAENLNECLWYYCEATIKFSNLNKYYSRNEK